jgi:hypothetical protein
LAKKAALARLFCFAGSVAGLSVENIQSRMAEAIAAYEVNDEKHQQCAANQDGDGDLQTELKIVKIRDSADHVGAEAAD